MCGSVGERRWRAAARGCGGNFRLSRYTWQRLNTLSSTLEPESHSLDVGMLLFWSFAVRVL